MTVPWPAMKHPLVAILRGITPSDISSVVGTLVEEGFEAIEVPLNSPDPMVSIAKAVGEFGNDALVGAGTVLAVEDCDRLADIGARLMVSPNTDPEVIEHATARGMVTMPGVFTPTEALLALKSGASALKFFPASTLGPEGIKAIRAILPPTCVVGAVGGVSEESFAAYRAASVEVFGLGSSLYRPGDPASEVRRRARLMVEAVDAAFDRRHRETSP